MKIISPADMHISAHVDPQGCIPANGLRDVCYPFFHFLALRVNPETKVHQSIGDGLLRAPVYHAVKFYHPASTHAEDIPYEISCGHS